MLRVKFERTSRNLSQERVAAAARIPQPAIALIERGRLIPTSQQLERLASVFDVPTESLLRDVEVVDK